jgi:diacylglycerol O-acyltransferase
MNKLSLLDLAFFVAESEASPKHVAGLMIYKRPARSPASFVADLYRELLAFTTSRRRSTASSISR